MCCAYVCVHAREQQGARGARELGRGVGRSRAAREERGREVDGDVFFCGSVGLVIFVGESGGERLNINFGWILYGKWFWSMCKSDVTNEGVGNVRLIIRDTGKLSRCHQRQWLLLLVSIYSDILTRTFLRSYNLSHICKSNQYLKTVKVLTKHIISTFRNTTSSPIFSIIAFNSTLSPTSNPSLLPLHQLNNIPFPLYRTLEKNIEETGARHNVPLSFFCYPYARAVYLPRRVAVENSIKV